MGLPNDFYQWLNLILLAAISFFLKRLVGRQDATEKELGEIKTEVAILLDRDRRKRIDDYERNGDTLR